MTVADGVDETVHVDVNEVGEVVELIGGGRMAPVQHVHFAPSFREVAQERPIGLEVEDGPVTHHRVDDAGARPV